MSSKNKSGYLIIGGVILIVLVIAVILIGRNKSDGTLSAEPSDSISASMAADDNPVTATLEANKQEPSKGQTTEKPGQKSELPQEAGLSGNAERQEEVRIVAVVDLSENGTVSTDIQSQTQEAAAELEAVQAEVVITDPSSIIEEIDLASEEKGSTSKTSGNVQGEQGKPAPQDMPVESESSTESVEVPENESQSTAHTEEPVTENSHETEGSTGTGEQMTTEPSAESVPEESAEEPVVPPVREVKILVFGEDSVTVPVNAPESLQGFDDLTGEGKYKLALEFDSVRAYNEYIVFLSKVAEKQRVPVTGGDAAID